MKVAVTEGRGDIRIKEAPLPEPGPYQCLCKIVACASCSGTDLIIISGKLPWEEKYPAVLGHESVGIVLQTGEKVRNIKKGDMYLRPAAVYPNEKLGNYYSIWGGFAEYGLVTDIRALMEDNPGAEPGYGKDQLNVPLSLNLSPAEAIMLITLKETCGYVFDMGAGLNDPVVVCGAGPVAMAMSFFAKISGVFPLIAVARRDEPLEYMKRFGVNHTINNSRQDMVKEVMDITGGRGARFVIETTGSPEIMLESVKMLSEDGRIAPYATYKEAMPESLDNSKVINPKPGEAVTHNYMMDMVRMGQLDLKSYYSHTMPFRDIEKGFEMLKNKKAFKIVFEMEEK